MQVFSTRQVADFLGVALWRVQRLFETGAVAEPSRFAGRRAVPQEAIPAVVDALRDRGWLPSAEEVAV